MLSAAKVGVGGVSTTTAPHPGLRFASAFPPHRFAGGGIRPLIYASLFTAVELLGGTYFVTGIA